ncbi:MULTISPECIES: DUF6984 family protein [unclassified Inquilinus]|uniref:DUF6984 family protein n=1 Tax=unclassified Inquilinus TaxID=2645927 RepID=UPI003F93BED7
MVPDEILIAEKKMPPLAATDYEACLAWQPIRSLHEWERQVLSALIEASSLDAALRSPEVLDTLRVRDMLDGGMGSIRFVAPQGETKRKLGAAGVAELAYVDVDGVLVSFALNLDQQGDLFEVDAWKVDSSPLRQPPSRRDLTVKR